MVAPQISASAATPSSLKCAGGRHYSRLLERSAKKEGLPWRAWLSLSGLVSGPQDLVVGALTGLRPASISGYRYGETSFS